MYHQEQNYSPVYRRFGDDRPHHQHQQQHVRTQMYNRNEYSHENSNGGRYHNKEREGKGGRYHNKEQERIHVYDPPDIPSQQPKYPKRNTTSFRSPTPPGSNFIFDDKAFIAIARAILSELEHYDFRGRNARERSSAVAAQLQKMMSTKQLIDFNESLKSRLARFGPPYHNMSQMEMLVHQCNSIFGEELQQFIRQEGSVSEVFHSPRKHHQSEEKSSSVSYPDEDRNFQRVYTPEIYHNDLTNHIIYDVKAREEPLYEAEAVTKEKMNSNHTDETVSSSCDGASDSDVYTIALEDIKGRASPTLADIKTRNKMTPNKVRFQKHVKSDTLEDPNIATPTSSILTPSKKNREEVEVFAPAALPENFTFEARKGDELFMVSVVSILSEGC